MSAFKCETQIHGPVAIIGDVHGQVDKLSTVLRRLERSPDFEHRWVVFIGDLVDRGPDPRRGIEMVLDLASRHSRTTAIMGNHEFAMCLALGWFPGSENSLWKSRWVDVYNSTTTFTSYSAAEGDLDDLQQKIPAPHRDFLMNLPWCVEHPHMLFVHAGLDPSLPYEVQRQILRKRDFTLNRPLWLCEKSLIHIDPPTDCSVAVVSGHVKVEEAIINPRRILVDTTGGDSGELSCVLMPEGLVITSDELERAPFVPGRGLGKSAPAKSSGWWGLWK